MFEKPGTSYVVMVLLFILPQSLYVIGDYIAWGVRFPLFRCQDSYMGTSIIPFYKEIGYVLSGIIRWTTPAGTLSPAAIAPWIWFAGVLFLFAATAAVISWHHLGNFEHSRYPGPLLIITGMLFLIWAIVQSGYPFIGPSGYSVPVGVPILLFCGYQFMKDANEAVVQD